MRYIIAALSSKAQETIVRHAAQNHDKSLIMLVFLGVLEVG